jgi:hypothetical protein
MVSLAGRIVILGGMENRKRRNQALEALAEFCSLAHLVNLHQINASQCLSPRDTRLAERLDLDQRSREWLRGRASYSR